MPDTFSAPSRLRRIALLVAAAFVAPPLHAGCAYAQGDDTRHLPFFVGETLSYHVRVSRFGNVGRAAMVVDTPQTVQGVATWRLQFDFRAKVGPVGAADHTESWLDPVSMSALRFHKRERHPLSKHDERVEIPAERASLDELSFMYFLRTLPLDPGTVTRYERHFDPARNPTVVRVLVRDTVVTPAGRFRTVRVEMRVQDPRRYHGEGVITLDLTDDHCRIPVRIESDMPVIGHATMSLTAENHPATHQVARVR